MKRAALLLTLVLALPAVASRADDKQAYLGVFAETSLMKMVGMPAMPELPPGVKLPAGVVLPGRPQRQLQVRLWSPGIAPDAATAVLAIPGGLKLGDKLDLGLYRPKASEGTGDTGDAGGPGAMPTDFTIKRYWGSSATVKPGQPDIFRAGDLTAEQKAAMRAQAPRRGAGGSYFYKPDWTTGYWPAENQRSAIAAEAGLPGHYALTTTYTGNVEIDVPDNVSFLAPLEMSSPDLGEQIDFSKPLVFRWKAVPNILGYHASIFAMQGKNTIIMWSSSEIKTDLAANYDYMQMSEVKDGVKATSIMAPDRVEVTVPAGIFQDCDMVMFRMIGWGPGAALPAGQPLPRVQTKTTLNIMLGGKMMRGMGGPGGFGGGGGAP